MSNSTIVTYSGAIIDPINPDPGAILISDIAHSLSQQCRFTGHTREFYSVAEHCVRCAEFLGKQGDISITLVLIALLHDASEAYLSDLARPIKKFSALGSAYELVEIGLERAIAERFGIRWPWPPPIRWVDNQLLWAEIRDLMPHMDNSGDLLEWSDQTTYEERITPWSPKTAESKYHDLFREITQIMQVGERLAGSA